MRCYLRPLSELGGHFRAAAHQSVGGCARARIGRQVARPTPLERLFRAARYVIECSLVGGGVVGAAAAAGRVQSWKSFPTLLERRAPSAARKRALGAAPKTRNNHLAAHLWLGARKRAGERASGGRFRQLGGPFRVRLNYIGRAIAINSAGGRSEKGVRRKESPPLAPPPPTPLLELDLAPRRRGQRRSGAAAAVSSPISTWARFAQSPWREPFRGSFSSLAAR